MPWRALQLSTAIINAVNAPKADTCMNAPSSAAAPAATPNMMSLNAAATNPSGVSDPMAALMNVLTTM